MVGGSHAWYVHVYTGEIGDTGKGRVKRGQEEFRARPGPLFCHAYESLGLSQDLTRDVIQQFSADTVEKSSLASLHLPPSLASSSEESTRHPGVLLQEHTWVIQM